MVKLRKDGKNKFFQHNAVIIGIKVGVNEQCDVHFVDIYGININK